MLVTVASAMLWITDQLQPWVIAVQVAAIGLSLARRRKPFAWQSSPIALNIGMFGIAGTTISLALDGNPATVSLAHFASLSQGLQLLDARPRKSEFLLVTLSLFQVILASNLTDSLLFPPLLLAFVFSAVWTLLVHTLRSEAIEAGEAGAAARALTPGLRNMTVMSSMCAILLALVLFALLPRMRTSMLQTGIGRGQAIAGFSDRVELGASGPIRSDRTVVLRVETLEGTPPEPREAYWRGLAFDAFDGRRWSITPPARVARAGSAKIGIGLGRGPDLSDLTQRVVREPVTGGVLFAAGTPRLISGALLQIESDLNGGLYDPIQTDQRIRYTVRTQSNASDDARLARDRALPPPGDERRYLALPVLSPQIGELARQIAVDASTDAERARALERHLRKHGRYTDSPPPLDGGAHGSPVEAFLLGELSGHCEYFASGMVVLARELGLPGRLVNGFAGGRENPLGGFIELVRADAHAWVEIHYEAAGWVRYDPTPPDLRLEALSSSSFADHLAALTSTIELWWFQRVVDFDSSDQIEALRNSLAAWRKLRTPDETDARSRRGAFAFLRLVESPLTRALVAGGVALALAALLAHSARKRRGLRALPAHYARALALLSRRGFVRGPGRTARGFAADVRAAAPSAGTAFGAITEAYLAERFGSRRPDAGIEGQLVRLRTALAIRRSGTSAR
jgi:transglutaminase-like putative cysteine protease